MPVLVTFKYNKDRIKNTWEKVETSFSPLPLPWKPEFWSNLPQNCMQPFPHPSDATYKIWSRLANWLQRYSSLKVWMTTTDHGRRRTDDGPLVYYKLTLWAFASGELKIWVITIFSWSKMHHIKFIDGVSSLFRQKNNVRETQGFKTVFLWRI